MRPSIPSLLSASLSPFAASALKERSLRPPMSVTTPTLIFLPVLALLDDDEPALVLKLELSSLPHAATPNAATLRVRAISVARNVLCTAPPSCLLATPGTGPGPGTLALLSVGERRAQRRARDRPQVVLAEAHALMGDRVLATERRAEPRRVVG